ncbi:MAG: response regulator transcription factor [Ignavibacteriaceae bacterium]|nr:response regulator transcription factor [Ignavibacteriaceae bacterium]
MEYSIIIADDHPIVRQGMKSLIAGYPGMIITGEAGDGLEALRLIEKTEPDLALIDINMPGLGGIEILKEIAKKKTGTRIIINTAYKDASLLSAALEYGAAGFLLKDTALVEIKLCLDKVLSGGKYISSELSDILLKDKAPDSGILSSSLSALTLTERKILKYVALNKTTKEIAAELFISYRTVENHRNNICKKLNLSGGNALLRFALDNKEKL